MGLGNQQGLQTFVLYGLQHGHPERLRGDNVFLPPWATNHQQASSIDWIPPPHSKGWIIIVIWLYIALNRTLNMDCDWVGPVPKV